MEQNLFYNNRLRSYANQNRNYGTKAEAFLWKFVLRAKKTGHKFRRQRPVLNYIADFMCMELKLIIEVDGYTHTDKNVVEKDAIRQKELELHGFKVIRFTDEDVLFNLDRVREKIVATLKELEAFSSLPPSGYSLKEGDIPSRSLEKHD